MYRHFFPQFSSISQTATIEEVIVSCAGSRTVPGAAPRGISLIDKPEPRLFTVSWGKFCAFSLTAAIKVIS